MRQSAGDLAEYLGAKVAGDRRAAISGLGNPEDAGPEDLIYAEGRHAERAAESRAVCVIARHEIAGKTTILSTNPKLTFAKAAAWLFPEPKREPSIHATAVISATAKVSKTAVIGAYVVMEDGVLVGDGTLIEPFCFVGKESRIGANCRLHPHVTLYGGSVLGDRVELHSGTVIGGDGFGYVFGEGKQWKFPQVGGVVIEDDVEIGCNTAVDRGSLGTTRIGRDTKIDNLVQVAHNVRIGEHSILVSQTGISGGTTLGNGVVVAGQAGFGERAVVEDSAVIGGQAGILPGKVIRSGQVVWGTPARPLEKFKQQHAWFGRLPELARRVKALEESLQARDAD
jgi:UDP-3-O-[3-hydroxymyristoyl] glucosamine N-acyltransferase